MKPANDNRPWPRGLSRDSAAAYLGIGVTLFDAMVGDGRMPRPKEVNARRVWDRYAIDTAFDDLPGGDNDDDHDDVWDRVAV